MILFINDHKRRSGKTTLARQILKDKNFIELTNMTLFLSRMSSFESMPEWILIDGATEFDIEIANSLLDKETVIFHTKYYGVKQEFKVPNFILVNNQDVSIKEKNNRQKNQQKNEISNQKI